MQQVLRISGSHSRQPKRTLFVCRHGERMDVVFGKHWLSLCSDSKGEGSREWEWIIKSKWVTLGTHQPSPVHWNSTFDSMLSNWKSNHRSFKPYSLWGSWRQCIWQLPAQRSSHRMEFFHSTLLVSIVITSRDWYWHWYIVNNNQPHLKL